MITEIIIAVVSTFVATFLLFMFRYSIGPAIDFIFFRVYPKVRGEYNVYCFDRKITVPDEDYEYEIDSNDEGSGISTSSSNSELLEWLKENDHEPYMKATIKQFAYKLSGELFYVSKGHVQNKDAFYGRITASRIILLHSESRSEQHHNFGTYLLEMTSNNGYLKGSRSFLCIECGSVDHDYIFLEKID